MRYVIKIEFTFNQVYDNYVHLELIRFVFKNKCRITRLRVAQLGNHVLLTEDFIVRISPSCFCSTESSTDVKD